MSDNSFLGQKSVTVDIVTGVTVIWAFCIRRSILGTKNSHCGFGLSLNVVTVTGWNCINIVYPLKGPHPRKPREAVGGDRVVGDAGGQAAADGGLHEEDVHRSDQGRSGNNLYTQSDNQLQ